MINEIVMCKQCRGYEYWDEMRWYNGKCLCRDCYQRNWETEHLRPYNGGDLEGNRPTRKDFLNQNKEPNNVDHACVGIWD